MTSDMPILNSLTCHSATPKRQRGRRAQQARAATVAATAAATPTVAVPPTIATTTATTTTKRSTTTAANPTTAAAATTNTISALTTVTTRSLITSNAIPNITNSNVDTYTTAITAGTRPPDDDDPFLVSSPYDQSTRAEQPLQLEDQFRVLSIHLSGNSPVDQAGSDNISEASVHQRRHNDAQDVKEFFKDENGRSYCKFCEYVFLSIFDACFSNIKFIVSIALHCHESPIATPINFLVLPLPSVVIL